MPSPRRTVRQQAVSAGLIVRWSAVSWQTGGANVLHEGYDGRTTNPRNLSRFDTCPAALSRKPAVLVCPMPIARRAAPG
jgi:hypothetical protein